MSFELDATGHASLTLASNTGVAGQLVIDFPGGTPTDVGLLQIYRGATGPKGDSGNAAVIVATQALGGYRCLRFDAASSLQYADSNDLTHARKIMGVTKQAYNSGDNVELVRFGELVDAGWAWNTTLPVYLGHNGVFTQTVPTFPDAAFLLVLGMPLSATKLLINIREPLALH